MFDYVKSMCLNGNMIESIVVVSGNEYPIVTSLVSIGNNDIIAILLNSGRNKSGIYDKAVEEMIEDSEGIIDEGKGYTGEMEEDKEYPDMIASSEEDEIVKYFTGE